MRCEETGCIPNTGFDTLPTMQPPLRMLCSLLVVFPALASDVRRSECFPIETLPPQLQSRAEKIFLDTLDSVALYTVINGLKPLTADLRHVGLADPRNLQGTTAIADLERIASVFRCGDEIQMFVCISCDPNRGRADLYVANKRAIAAIIKRRTDLFASLGVTGFTPPAQVLYLAERFLAPEGRDAKSNIDDTVRYTTIYGLLFGYPEYAVASYAAGLSGCFKRRAAAGCSWWSGTEQTTSGRYTGLQQTTSCICVSRRTGPCRE
jgi:tetrahydromethanopterin S-methyltransferase subunit F